MENNTCQMILVPKSLSQFADFFTLTNLETIKDCAFATGAASCAQMLFELHQLNVHLDEEADVDDLVEAVLDGFGNISYLKLDTSAGLLIVKSGLEESGGLASFT